MPTDQRVRTERRTAAAAAVTLLVSLVAAQGMSPSTTPHAALPAAPTTSPLAAPQTTSQPAQPGQPSPATTTTAGRSSSPAQSPAALPPGTQPTRTRGPVQSFAPTQAPAPHAATTSTAPATPAPLSDPATALLPRPKLSSPTSVRLTPSAPILQLDNARDYVVTISTSAFSHPVSVLGGHDVVIEDQVLRYEKPAIAKTGWKVRGLLLKGQTGTMWVRGLQIRGPLAEGIDLDQRQPKAVVVLRDIAIDPVRGTESTNHADLLQTWAGPDRLVVDGYRGSSDYQGMFLRPRDQWSSGPWPSFFALRDIDLDVSQGSYALWADGHGAFPLQVTSTEVRPHTTDRDEWLWPKPSTGDTTWAAVQALD